MVEVMLRSPGAAKGGYEEVHAHAYAMLVQFISEAKIQIKVPPCAFPAQIKEATPQEQDFAVPVAFNVAGAPSLVNCLADRGIFRGNFFKFMDADDGEVAGADDAEVAVCVSPSLTRMLGNPFRTAQGPT